MKNPFQMKAAAIGLSVLSLTACFQEPDVSKSRVMTEPEQMELAFLFTRFNDPSMSHRMAQLANGAKTLKVSYMMGAGEDMISSRTSLDRIADGALFKPCLSDEWKDGREGAGRFTDSSQAMQERWLDEYPEEGRRFVEVTFSKRTNEAFGPDSIVPVAGTLYGRVCPAGPAS